MLETDHNIAKGKVEVKKNSMQTVGSSTADGDVIKGYESFWAKDCKDQLPKNKLQDMKDSSKI